MSTLPVPEVRMKPVHWTAWVSCTPASASPSKLPRIIVRPWPSSATHHTAAHTIAADTGDREQQARAHAGLGHAHRALGDLALAREHHQQALTLYVDLGMPEAAEVRAHLITLDIPEPNSDS